MSHRNQASAYTESDLLAMLARRYGEAAGNGPAWAFVTGVRDAAGFDAKRTIDAMAMSLWPSRGLYLHAFEVKCSRSDWQRELKDPSKAERFCQLADFFWLVVADAKIVHDGELPPGWGLLAARGGKLVQLQGAEALRDLSPPAGAGRGRGLAPMPPAFARSFLASLLRAAGATRERTPSEVKEAVEQARAAGRQEAERDGHRAQRELDDLRTLVREFEQASGLRLKDGHWGGPTAKQMGDAVRRLVDDDRELERLQTRLEGVRAHALALHREVERLASVHAERPQLDLGIAAA